jgi:hypothetical protein
MIVRPQRSITRFFIPLIDVLILLFCIFLLMPFVSKPDDGKGADLSVERDPTMPDNLEQLQQELAAARRRIEELKKLRTNIGERLSVRVLEIDKDSGKLHAFDGEVGRQEVKDQADAQRLINQQRSRAAGKDAFFLILYPRELTGWPVREQIDTYRRWFREVPHGFDNPFAAEK